MDLLKILKNAGIEESRIEEVKDSITREIGTDFIPKTQYQKKVLALNELQEKYNDIEAAATSENKDEYKEKYSALEQEFNAFKTNLEAEKVRGTKLSILKSKLEEEKFNKDIIGLLAKEFDIDSLEIEDNNIKEWDSLATPIKDKYKGFIQEEVVSGTSSANPTQITNTKVDTNPLADALGKLL